MLDRTKKKIKLASVNDCVAVPVSEFDRGRGDPANLIGIIMEKNEAGQFRIGTRAGVISNWLERNSFEMLKFQGLKQSDVPNKELSVREAVRSLSVGTGQGFRKCTCKSSCSKGRCSCHKNSMICNSACHPGRTCDNHD